MKAPESIIQRGFSAGELAPVLHARADNAKYVDGLRTCRNFMVLRHGAVANRAGFRFVSACKTNDANVRLQKYVADNPNESILVEVGSGYFRFFKNGAPITVDEVTAWSNATAYEVGDLAEDGGVNYYCTAAHTNQPPPDDDYWYALDGDTYEIPTPYTTGGLIGSWEQSGNVVVITHRLHDPRELIYFGDTYWVLQLADTVPTLAAPTGVVLTPPGAGPQTYAYQVTARKAETYEESLPSTAVSAAAVLAPTVAAPHTLTWTAIPAAAEYNIYCDPLGNGVFGYVGASTTNTFANPGTVPDFMVTPPLDRTPFVSAETRPHLATHYQQRRFYAQSISSPDGIEASRTGFYNNFGISSPLQDDDALSFRIAGNSNHPIRAMLGLKTLLVLTDGGGWTVGQPKTPLTPSNLPTEQETYIGAAPDVRPVVVGNAVIYLQSRGVIMRDLQFDIQVEGLAGRDLTLFAAHLFDGHVIDDMDFALTPHSIVWAVRDDGTLLGLTYVREQEVWGWHRHDTDGDFERVCTVPEATEDAVYVIVSRTIGSGLVRYIERLESREITNFDQNVFFVDSGLSYSGEPADSFSGLDHLEGKRVAIVADGSVITNGVEDVDEDEQYIVTGGTVTLPAEASHVHVGLPITHAQIETLDIDAHGTAIRDKAKRVGSVTVLLERSSRVFWSGPNATDVLPYELSRLELPADEYTGQVELALESDWEKPGRILIWQKDPLPITVLGILPNLVVGG